MKKSIIITAVIVLILNLVAKLIITDYTWFNMILSSLVLAHTAILLCLFDTPKVADGFRVSLSSIFSFIGFIEFIVAQFSIQSVKDNWIILTMIVVSGFQWLIYFVVIILKRDLDNHPE